MSHAPVQIFISYARDDDALPPNSSEAKGFVTALHDELQYEFQNLGEPRPKIWRDTRRIDKADQFAPLIEGGIAASALLVVVLSKNWLASSYCRQELEGFARRWRGEGGLAVEHRIVVVGKRHVAPEERPALLQGQEGFAFYSLDDPGEVGLEHEFFVRGQIRDRRRYLDRMEELAGFLWRRAQRLTEKPESAPAAPGAAAKMERTVYLAKPGMDMRAAYERVAKELAGRGYVVVPPPAADIPHESSAVTMIDAALAQSEVSVHLLGEKPGFAPEGEEPIVKLQLTRAAERASAGDGAGLRRIIWAPKVLDEGGDAAAAAARDPLAVLARFHRYVEGDKVEGDTLSTFVEFLGQHLLRTVPTQETVAPGETGSKVYIYHRLEDSDYAFNLAKAFLEHRVQPMLPAFEGPDAERIQLHRQYLRDCDAIVLCWGAAHEVWAKATAHELSDWRQLGRTRTFARRALVAGPPPGPRKKMFVDLFPKHEIDMVIDLTGREQPSPDDIKTLVPGA